MNTTASSKTRSAGDCAKHTPGPWYRNIRAGGKYPTVFAGNSPRHVHIAHVQQIRDNPDETEANIDLIAAAPELLEAAKVIMDAFEVLADESWALHYSSQVLALQKAICKAEGQS